jgi:hypothetical protein
MFTFIDNRRAPDGSGGGNGDGDGFGDGDGDACGNGHGDGYQFGAGTGDGQNIYGGIDECTYSDGHLLLACADPRDLTACVINATVRAEHARVC